MRERISRMAAVLCAAAAAAGLAGCYERTVKTRGFGTTGVRVERPYQESNAVDDFLFGPLDKNQQDPENLGRPHTRPRDE